MPNEPDNKMDELLRAYAQKRKADAGDAFELHPATRRLFQAEVSKLRPKDRQQRESWFDALLRLWPRVAFAVGVFAMLGFAAWLFFPERERAGREQLLAKSEGPELARKPADSKPDANRLPAEVARTMREDARPTERDIDGDEGARSRRVSSDQVAERLQDAPQSFQQPKESAANRPVEEFKKKQVESILLENEVLSTKVEGLQRQKKGEVAMDSATIPAPTATPLRPLARTPARALSGNVSAIPDGETNQTAEKLSSSAKLAANGASATTLGDNVGGSLVFLQHGTFTNSPTSYQLANAALLNANTIGRQNDLESNRSRNYSFERNGTALTSQQAQSPRQEQQVALAKNEAAANLQLNQAPSAQPSALGKDAVRAQAGFGVAVTQDQTVLQKSAGQITNTSIASAESADKRNVALRGVASTAQPDLRGGYTQGGKAEDMKRGTAAATLILSSFRLEQSGSQVRVLDADGSVYEGAVTMADDVAGSFSSRSRGSENPAQTVERETTPMPLLGPSQQQSTRGAGTGGSLVPFRVAGTNETFKVPVTLEGSFWRALSSNDGGAVSNSPEVALESRSNASTDDRRTQQKAAPIRPDSAVPTPSVLRITGRALVGGTNEIRIDAIRSGE
jgi:hypothetical protein